MISLLELLYSLLRLLLIKSLIDFNFMLLHILCVMIYSLFIIECYFSITISIWDILKLIILHITTLIYNHNIVILWMVNLWNRLIGVIFDCGLGVINQAQILQFIKFFSKSFTLLFMHNWLLKIRLRFLELLLLWNQ